MSFRDLHSAPPKTGMTSVEAAALYASEGRTMDPVLATMYQDAVRTPELLLPRGSAPLADAKDPELVIDDPEVAERTDFAKALGFDFEVDIQEAKARVVIRATESGLSTTCIYKAGNDAYNSKRMTKAILRLKALHDLR